MELPPDDGCGHHRNMSEYISILQELFNIIIQCALLEQCLDKQIDKDARSEETCETVIGCLLYKYRTESIQGTDGRKYFPQGRVWLAGRLLVSPTLESRLSESHTSLDAT
jgi:hypothetical protein